MATGIEEAVIEERGVALRLQVRGQWYDLSPTPASIFRLSHELGLISKRMEREKRTSMTADDQADAADQLYRHVAGEHERFFRTLPTEMQGDIVNRLWKWYSDLEMPVIESDPTPRSSLSPATPELRSAMS